MSSPTAASSVTSKGQTAEPGDQGREAIDQGGSPGRRLGSTGGHAVDHEQQRHDDRDDRDLADLDPDIEAGEGNQQRIPRQPEGAERAGETETVDQAEEEGDPPAPLDPPVEVVLQGDGDDAGGD